MKRDINLCRQLLMDIENHAADCSLNALRTGLTHDADERVRYHLRLLLDAGFVKEIDCTTDGVPCVRLTHSGQEFIELARSEARWREAKWISREQTGGVSLIVIRALLTRWAVESTARGERQRRVVRPYRPYSWRSEVGYRAEPSRWEPFRWEACRGEPDRAEPGYRYGGYRGEPTPVERDGWEEDDRPRADYRDYRERCEPVDRWYDRHVEAAYEGEHVESMVNITLPVSMI